MDIEGLVANVRQSAEHWRDKVEALEEANTRLRTYTAPGNGLPYSTEGYADLRLQLGRAARDCDSSLHEMAGLTIARLADDLERRTAERDALSEHAGAMERQLVQADRLREAGERALSVLDRGCWTTEDRLIAADKLRAALADPEADDANQR